MNDLLAVNEEAKRNGQRAALQSPSQEDAVVDVLFEGLSASVSNCNEK